MFILIRVDDYGPIETDLLGTYNRYEEAFAVMKEDYDKEVATCGFTEDYRYINDSDAACWTEMEGGSYWSIFCSDDN